MLLLSLKLYLYQDFNLIQFGVLLRIHSHCRNQCQAKLWVITEEGCWQFDFSSFVRHRLFALCAQFLAERIRLQMGGYYFRDFLSGNPDAFLSPLLLLSLGVRSQELQVRFKACIFVSLAMEKKLSILSC